MSCPIWWRCGWGICPSLRFRRFRVDFTPGSSSPYQSCGRAGEDILDLDYYQVGRRGEGRGRRGALASEYEADYYTPLPRHLPGVSEGQMVDGPYWQRPSYTSRRTNKWQKTRLLLIPVLPTVHQLWSGSGGSHEEVVGGGQARRGWRRGWPCVRGWRLP